MINKLGRIIMSRLKPKSTEEPWVQKRLEVCRKCPFNTDNIAKKSFLDNAKIFVNKFFNLITMTRKVSEEAVCSLCGCMLVYKAPDVYEDCPKNKWEKNEFENSEPIT